MVLLIQIFDIIIINIILTEPRTSILAAFGGSKWLEDFLGFFFCFLPSVTIAKKAYYSEYKLLMYTLHFLIGFCPSYTQISFFLN